MMGSPFLKRLIFSSCCSAVTFGKVPAMERSRISRIFGSSSGLSFSNCLIVSCRRSPYLTVPAGMISSGADGSSSTSICVTEDADIPKDETITIKCEEPLVLGKARKYCTKEPLTYSSLKKKALDAVFKKHVMTVKEKNLHRKVLEERFHQMYNSLVDEFSKDAHNSLSEKAVIQVVSDALEKGMPPKKHEGATATATETGIRNVQFADQIQVQNSVQSTEEPAAPPVRREKPKPKYVPPSDDESDSSSDSSDEEEEEVKSKKRGKKFSAAKAAKYVKYKKIAKEVMKAEEDEKRTALIMKRIAQTEHAKKLKEIEEQEKQTVEQWKNIAAQPSETAPFYFRPGASSQRRGLF